MDPGNTAEFCSRKASDYWGQVDLYIGGTEHAVGHLLYSRMWTKALYDLGHIGFDEPFKKLLNQGMIQGSSRFIYRKRGTHTFVSAGLVGAHEVDQLHVDVNIVDGVELDTEAFKKWKPDYTNAEFILEDGKYLCGVEVEKMSKSKFNTVNPDDLVQKYGADTFRMYEMFLGPVEQSKPWDTKGIEGVHRFIKKFWRLFFDEIKGKVWVDETPTAEELKILHKTIKKIEEDTDRYSFNTAISAFMICINELYDAGCHKKAILEQVLILITPYAPHFAEELWSALGNEGLIVDAAYPIFDVQYVLETAKEYPVSINGKVRANISIALDASEEQVREIVLANEAVQKWVADSPVKKLIFVKGRMINIVI
jgi:leucyl-tRNA synthetase